MLSRRYNPVQDAFLLVLAVIVCLPVLFHDTTLAMAKVWMVNETFTHGFLVFPVTIWMIWSKKDEIREARSDAEPLLLIPLVAILAVWIIGSAVNVEVVQQFSLVTMILLLIWAVAGRTVFLKILFPLMLLYFAVPFGQALIPPLMQFTASFTISLIEITGVPVYRDGLAFSLPTGSWSVVEECSGVRYLIASLYLGSIYAYLNYTLTKKRMIFIFFSLLTPVIGNGLRAFGIVMTGHLSGMELAVGVDHLLYGWVFFGILMVSLFYIGSFWRDEDEFTTGTVQVDSDVLASESLQRRYLYSPLSVISTACVLMVSAILFSGHIDKQRSDIHEIADIKLPGDISGWMTVYENIYDWHPEYYNPVSTISLDYRLGKDIVRFNMAYYPVQRQGSEAVTTSNRLINPYASEWRLVASRVYKDDLRNVNESELLKKDSKLLVWSWYRIGRFDTEDRYIAKLLEIYSLLIEQRNDAAMISVATEFDGTLTASRERLKNFLDASSTEITTIIERARQQ